MSVTQKIVGSLVVGLLLSGCQNQEAPPAEVIPVVKTIAINNASQQPVWSLTGTLSARYQTSLAFRVGGKIEQRHINVGQTIQPGQVLFALDKTDYQLAANIATANIRSTESEIKNAQLELERYQQMLSRNLISQQTIDQAQTQLSVLQERLKAQNLQQQQANNQLEYTRLISPGLGKVLTLQAEEGEVVAAGQALATVALDGSREVTVAIPENRLPGLPKQAKAYIFGLEKAYPVELREMAGQADSASRTWRARYAFKLADSVDEMALNSLNLGQTVKLVFEANNALIRIPNTALYEQADFASIWQFKDGKVHRVPVKVKRLSDRWAWVEGDFANIKSIVSLGVHRLNEGQTVKESAE